MNSTFIRGLLLLSLIFPIISFGDKLDDNKDHDYQHITFINQTKYKLKFKVFDGGMLNKDKTKSLKKHTANYISLNKNKCEQGKKFKIQIKNEDTNNWLEGSKGGKLTIHRKCKEYLYVWHQNGKYHVNNKPHINADLNGCDSDTKKHPILFAHGYNDTQEAWSKFADHIKTDKRWKNTYRVFRTSVSQDGSMRKRAHMLAKYINKAAKQCNIKDATLRVVAHSMGGLDIRYLISNPRNSPELAKAGKKIERIYTLATPHKGDNLGNFAQAGSDAARDLTPKHMDWFNKHNKYSNFKDSTGRKVHLTAIRFKCGHKQDGKGSDGVVSVKKQIYEGAPHSRHIFRARHTDGVGGAVCKGQKIEPHRITVLNRILYDHRKKVWNNEFD